MSKRTILLIDSDAAEAARLTAAGFEVEIAHDGVEGLEAFERLAPELVVVDAILPRKHGLDVCREIKKSERGKHIPVVMTIDGEHGRQYGRDTLLSFGCDDLVEKPADGAALIAVCRRLLGEAEPAAAPIETTDDVLEVLVQEIEAIPLADPATATTVREVVEYAEVPSPSSEVTAIPLARPAPGPAPPAAVARPPVAARPVSAPAPPAAVARPPVAARPASAPAPPAAVSRPPVAARPASAPAPPAAVARPPVAARPVSAPAPPAAVARPPVAARPASAPAPPAAVSRPPAAVPPRPAPTPAPAPAPASQVARPPAPAPAPHSAPQRPAPAAPRPAAAKPSAPMSESEILDRVDSVLGDGSPSGGGGVKWMLIALALVAVGGGIGFVVMRGGASPEPVDVARISRPAQPPPAAFDFGPPAPMLPDETTPSFADALPGGFADPVDGAPGTAAPRTAPTPTPTPTSLPVADTRPVERAPAKPVERAAAKPVVRPPADPPVVEARRTRSTSSPEFATTPPRNDAPLVATGTARDEAPAAPPDATASPSADLIASDVRPAPAAESTGDGAGSFDSGPAEVVPFVDLAPVPVEPAAPVVRAPTVRRGDLVDRAALDVQPVPLERPAPEYDTFARRLQQQGTVTLRVLVDERGRVAETELIEGIPRSRLNDSALEGVRRWSYRPAEKAGVPVKVWIVESVRFRL